MTKLEKSLLYVSGGLVMFILILGGVSFVMWLEAHDSAIKAEAKVEVLQQQRETVKSDTQQKLEDVKQERSSAATPREQIRYVTQTIPIHLAEPESSSLPGQLPYLEMPTADLPRLADFVETFRADRVKLEGCTRELELCDAQLSALKSARKTTFWNRAKWFAIGGAAGAGVIAATRR